MYKPSGTQRRKLIMQLRRMHALKQSVLFLPLIAVSLTLPGCITTGTTVTTNSALAAFRAITYSVAHDTAATVRQIRVHNAVGRRLHLWK